MVRGGVVRGGIVRGGVVRGGVIRSSAVQDGAVQESGWGPIRGGWGPISLEYKFFSKISMKCYILHHDLFVSA